jgi:hypothetical protein
MILFFVCTERSGSVRYLVQEYNHHVGSQSENECSRQLFLLAEWFNIYEEYSLSGVAQFYPFPNFLRMELLHSHRLPNQMNFKTQCYEFDKI